MIKQALRFIIVGGISTIVNYIIFYILFNFLHVYYVLSFCIGFLSGVVVGYFLNKNWTYEVKHISNKYVYKYLFLYTFSLFLGMIIIYSLVRFLNCNYLIAELITIVFTTITNFIGTKFFVFKK